jgi:outer membrane receptor protein involved in Fe transport
VTLVLAPRPAIAQTGILVGQVTSALTGMPVTTAQVSVSGTALRVAADADGRFRIMDVPISAREVVARAPGYETSAAFFSLTSRATATVLLSMSVRPTELDAIVVTGSAGDMRRRAVGHSVAVVKATEVVSSSAVANVTEVLQTRVPGLTILPGSGSAGTAANYRLRGTGSLAATNSPTIYVDGVRTGTRSQGNYGERFGQSTTALDAINPADIASVEVIRGPSAATLYGADAAAGVIQIFTRKGKPGRVEWESRFDLGQLFALGQHPPIFEHLQPIGAGDLQGGSFTTSGAEQDAYRRYAPLLRGIRKRLARRWMC